jgi:hypothetical protein
VDVEQIVPQRESASLIQSVLSCSEKQVLARAPDAE